MTDALALQSLADMLSAYCAGLTTPKIGLFTGAADPTPDTILADLPEPTGSWYAQVAAVFAQVFKNGDGSVEIHTQAQQFNYTGVDPAEVISGWFIAAGAVPKYITGKRLDAPVSMGDLLSSLIAYPSIKLPAVLAA